MPFTSFPFLLLLVAKIRDCALCRCCSHNLRSFSKYGRIFRKYTLSADRAINVLLHIHIIPAKMIPCGYPNSPSCRDNPLGRTWAQRRCTHRILRRERPFRVHFLPAKAGAPSRTLPVGFTGSARPWACIYWERTFRVHFLPAEVALPVGFTGSARFSVHFPSV